MDARRWLAFLVEIADETDAIALRHFGRQDLAVSEKPDQGPVTEADLAIEDRVRRRARERHPDLGVLGEEQGEAAVRGETRLIVDPIDATRNFVRRIPVFATLLAVEHRGELVAGLVSAPALGLRWSAARGAGAHEGSRPLRVSAQRELARAQLFHGSLGGDELPRGLPGLMSLASRTHRQRGFGDFWQHCLVAAGSGDLAVDPAVRPWDVAPLILLVEEAGGRATSLAGERSIHAGSLVTSNGHLHEAALAILAGPGPGTVG